MEQDKVKLGPIELVFDGGGFNVDKVFEGGDGETVGYIECSAETWAQVLNAHGGQALLPTLPTAVKLASLATHVREGRSASGHEFDWSAVDTLLGDPEVADYMKALDAAALLPVAR